MKTKLVIAALLCSFAAIADNPIPQCGTGTTDPCGCLAPGLSYFACSIGIISPPPNCTTTAPPCDW